jgi:hypothetical protein
MPMQIEVYEEFNAQPLDDEGDPKGEPIKLAAGRYILKSGFTRNEDGAISAWVEDFEGNLYEARGLRVS